MIRWTDLDQAGNDHGIAIDDLTVIARAGSTAGGATLSGRVATADGRGIGKAYVTVSGGDLPAPLRALTNPFGYYTFPEVPAGQTYVISVGSKRYSFSNPVQVVSPGQDIADIDFIAVP